LLAAPTAAFLWDHWTRSITNNGHGMMVPFLSGLLASHALRRLEDVDEGPSPWGFAILVPALLIVAFDAAIHTELLGSIGLLLALPGLSLLLLGPTRTRALLFPWFLLFFMLPIPRAIMDQIHLVLRHIATAGTGFLLRLFDLPVLIEGFYIYQPRGILWVANACSGFSALYASVTVALVLAYLSESWWNRLLLVGLSVPLALACNVVRIFLLALLVTRPNGPQLLDGPLHPISGWITFMVAFAVLLWIADMRRWKDQSWSGSRDATSPT
jgi:exosortase